MPRHAFVYQVKLFFHKFMHSYSFMCIHSQLLLFLSSRCPQLRSLSLKRSNMSQAMLNCPLLQLLDIASCHKLLDAVIRSAAISCPQLESLDVSNCSCVSDETLREIAQACAGLHSLNASYCPNISLEVGPLIWCCFSISYSFFLTCVPFSSLKSVHLPMLTVLKLHSCEGITSASMTWIANSHALEVGDCFCLIHTHMHIDLQVLPRDYRVIYCRFWSLIIATCWHL